MMSLLHLCEGNHTEKDLQQLNTRLIDPGSPNYPNLAQHLYPTNVLVTPHNKNYFWKL